MAKKTKSSHKKKVQSTQTPVSQALLWTVKVEEFKRALAIDPNYEVAKQNLSALPETRRNGPPDVMGWTEPFAGKVKVSSTKLLK